MPTNITIKGIPDDVYESIRKKAELNHRSINSEVIVNLKKAVQSKPVDSSQIIHQAKKLRERAKGALSLEEVQLAIEEGRP